MTRWCPAALSNLCYSFISLASSLLGGRAQSPVVRVPCTRAGARRSLMGGGCISFLASDVHHSAGILVRTQECTFTDEIDTYTLDKWIQGTALLFKNDYSKVSRQLTLPRPLLRSLLTCTHTWMLSRRWSLMGPSASQTRRQRSVSRSRHSPFHRPSCTHTRTHTRTRTRNRTFSHPLLLAYQQRFWRFIRATCLM
jgi:hypothetical protein